MVNNPTTHPADQITKQFWLSCLKSSWRGTSPEENIDLSGVNWHWILSAARYHRILESVNHLWESNNSIPETVRREAWCASQMARHKSKAIIEALGELQDIVRKDNLQVVLLKSPTYIFEAFSGFEQRNVEDIDILTQAKDLRILASELKILGYQGENRRRRHKGQEWLFHNGKVLIEIHLSASNRKRFQRLLSIKSLIDHAKIFEPFAPLLRMSPEDEALIFVLHAYHHGFREALWLRDLSAWWEIRNPAPNLILSTFKHIGLGRIGWIAWLGMEYMGWNMPHGWNYSRWGCSSSFDRLVRRFWQNNIYQSGETRQLILLRRWLELCAAQGIRLKLGAFFPLFSWRSISQIYRPRKILSTKKN